MAHVDMPVPDVVGKPWREARRQLDECGPFPTSDDPDEPPLAALGWPGGVVASQDPPPGGSVSRGARVVLHLVKPDDNPGTAGVREPRRPMPPPSTLTVEAPLGDAGADDGQDN